MRTGGTCKLACKFRDKRLTAYIFIYLFTYIETYIYINTDVYAGHHAIVAGAAIVACTIPSFFCGTNW